MKKNNVIPFFTILLLAIILISCDGTAEKPIEKTIELDFPEWMRGAWYGEKENTGVSSQKTSLGIFADDILFCTVTIAEDPNERTFMESMSTMKAYFPEMVERFGGKIVIENKNDNYEVKLIDGKAPTTSDYVSISYSFTKSSDSLVLTVSTTFGDSQNAEIYILDKRTDGNYPLQISPREFPSSMSHRWGATVDGKDLEIITKNNDVFQLKGFSFDQKKYFPTQNFPNINLGKFISKTFEESKIEIKYSIFDESNDENINCEFIMLKDGENMKFTFKVGETTHYSGVVFTPITE